MDKKSASEFDKIVKIVNDNIQKAFTNLREDFSDKMTPEYCLYFILICTLETVMDEYPTDEAAIALIEGCVKKVKDCYQ